MLFDFFSSFQVAWSVARLVSSVLLLFHLPAELEFLCGHDGHALKGSSFFMKRDGEIWIPVGLVVPWWSSFGTAFVDAGASCPLRSRAERLVPDSRAGCPRWIQVEELLQTQGPVALSGLGFQGLL